MSGQDHYGRRSERSHAGQQIAKTANERDRSNAHNAGPHGPADSTSEPLKAMREIGRQRLLALLLIVEYMGHSPE